MRNFNKTKSIKRTKYIKQMHLITTRWSMSLAVEFKKMYSITDSIISFILEISKKYSRMSPQLSLLLKLKAHRSQLLKLISKLFYPLSDLFSNSNKLILIFQIIDSSKNLDWSNWSPCKRIYIGKNLHIVSGIYGQTVISIRVSLN